MEETSGGAPEPSPPADAEAECSTRRTTKPGTKRLFVTFSVLLSFLLGLPFLLKSTEIYRSPLPFHSIDSLSAQLQAEPPSLPCRFQAVFLRSSHRIPEPALADRIGFLIAEDMRRRTGNDPLCGGCGRNFSISVTIDSGAECARSRFGSGKACLWRCGEVGFDGLGGSDEVVDELLDSALKGRGECLEGGGGKVYTVVVMEREDDEEEEALRVVVGKHRHAWMMGKVSETDAVLMIGKIFVNFFMNGGKEEGEVGKAEFVPVGLDGSVVLSFSLLNADPSDWVFAW